ncbi:MAG: hypothetical protein J6J87_00495 [Oscillospiraceae bacterium]|nr:hypothetical protein [Oscillospiraceae bacterium]
MELTDRVERERLAKEAVYAEMKEHPIDLDGLYNALVNTIHYDYVGFEHKRKYYMPNESRTYVFSNYRYGTLTMEILARSLHQLVGDLHDRHLKFHCEDWIDYRNLGMPYRVRGAKDCLYVTSARPGAGVVPGDKILEVQSMPPERIRAYMRNVAFNSDIPERELWGGYLRMARSLTVEHADGRRERVETPPCPPFEENYPVEFRMLEDNTAYLKLERMDREAIDALLAQHSGDIAGSKKLILDLRRNVGGDWDACDGLLPYLVDRERSLTELFGDEGCWCLFTENNCNRRYDVLSAFRATLSDPEEIAMIDRELALYKDNVGKGLVYLPPEPVEGTVTPASAAPEQVVVLTDTFCEDEGEAFAAQCKRCGSKVTVMGRPTMGTLDYFDPITVAVHEKMTLSYPIRMTHAAHEGRGISEKGLPVDEYIPWTPAEIGRDLILERAMAL